MNKAFYKVVWDTLGWCMQRQSCMQHARLLTLKSTRKFYILRTACSVGASLDVTQRHYFFFYDKINICGSEKLIIKSF